MLGRMCRGAWLGFVFVLVMAAGSTQALVVTPLDTESNVSGSIAGTTGNWSDSQQTLDFEFVEVTQSFGQLAVRSQVTSSYAPTLQRFSVQTGQSTTLGFSVADTTTLDYDYDYSRTIFDRRAGQLCIRKHASHYRLSARCSSGRRRDGVFDLRT